MNVNFNVFCYVQYFDQNFESLLSIRFNQEFLYRISNSPWVSPNHVVPKTQGINVKKNEIDEDVQTRVEWS